MQSTMLHTLFVSNTYVTVFFFAYSMAVVLLFELVRGKMSNKKVALKYNKLFKWYQIDT